LPRDGGILRWGYKKSASVRWTCADQNARQEEGDCEHKLAKLVDRSFFLFSVLPTQIQKRSGDFFDHEKEMIGGATPAEAVR
jgi:hypothetical protein